MAARDEHDEMFRAIGSQAAEVERAEDNAGAVGDSAADAAPRLKRTEGDVFVIKSLCVNCEEDGVTRLLCTRIPFFRDVILMAFECDHCGYRNSEVQSAEYQEKACRFELTATSREDLNRQLVKSDKATVVIPELEFEIPPNTQKGVFTTVEGLLDTAIESLSTTQALRRSIDPEGADKVDAFITRLAAVKDGDSLPFTVVLDDPSGNSFLENSRAPLHDPHLRVRYYPRTAAQNNSLGLFAEASRGGMEVDEHGNPIGEHFYSTSASEAAAVVAAAGAGSIAPSSSAGGDDGLADDDSNLAGSSARTLCQTASAAASSVAVVFAGVGSGDGNIPGAWHKGGALIRNKTERARATEEAQVATRRPGALPGLLFESSASSGVEKEVMLFPQDCANCSTRGECRMAVTDVPHFKEVILMCFNCDVCGWRDVEVKGGGAVPPQGSVFTLRYDPDAADAAADLTRDVIKGDTAAIDIPELELHVEGGSLGGMYTTVEGLLTAVRDRLRDSDQLAGGGGSGDARDSVAPSRLSALSLFLDRLDFLVRGSAPFTLIITDPMANSWLYSPFAPDPDPRLTHTAYTRSYDEDLRLGLIDMKVEGYQTAAGAPAATE